MGILEAKEILRHHTTDDLNWSRWAELDSGMFQNSHFIKVAFKYRDSELGYCEGDEYAREMEKLERFCIEHDLNIHGHISDYVLSDVASAIYYEFYLADQESLNLTENGRSGFGTLLPIGEIQVCQECGSYNSIFRSICVNCSAYLNCSSCDNSYISWLSLRQSRGQNDVSFVVYSPGDHCVSCSSLCSGCGNPWRNATPHLAIDLCESCNPRYNCRNCGTIEYSDSPDHGYCENCYERVCADCSSFVDEGNFVIEEGRNICSRCFNALDRNIEIFDEDSEMPATRLALPVIEGRERIRFCGLEIEGVNIHNDGHNILAQDLYDLGLSGFNRRRGYHERYDGGFVHVERDSSCDWETVIGPINMAANQDVRRLNIVIKAIRNRIKDKTIKLSLNCGLHIHVSAERVGIKQAHNLHLLYTYMEDVMYRIGAAKWPMHRAIINGDHSYQLSPRSDKRIHFVNQYMDNRYHGLSFSNYFQKMLNNCQCGAGRFGMFEECECSLNKCTFEFRLFNTTANTRKIHAYTALTQALTAKALLMNEFNLEEMPAHAFDMVNVKDLNSTQQEVLFEKWMPRMKFILEELPLTDDEKLSILYCVESSELSPIMGYCEEIMNNNAEVAA